MSAFDCDFDAPMYVDFNNIDDDQNNPDSFFGKPCFKNQIGARRVSRFWFHCR